MVHCSTCHPCGRLPCNTPWNLSIPQPAGTTIPNHAGCKPSFHRRVSTHQQLVERHSQLCRCRLLQVCDCLLVLQSVGSDKRIIGSEATGSHWKFGCVLLLPKAGTWRPLSYKHPWYGRQLAAAAALPQLRPPAVADFWRVLLAAPHHNEDLVALRAGCSISWHGLGWIASHQRRQSGGGRAAAGRQSGVGRAGLARCERCVVSHRSHTRGSAAPREEPSRGRL